MAYFLTSEISSKPKVALDKELLNTTPNFFFKQLLYIVDSEHKLLSCFIFPIMFIYSHTFCELMVVSSKYLCLPASNH